jgi:hypothetical protein
VKKHRQLQELLEHYTRELTDHGDNFVRPADKEAFLLKLLIDWELAGNPVQDWGFRSDGLNAIREDFVLLADYEDGQHMANVEQRSKHWGKFLLTAAQRQEHDSLPEDQRDAFVLKHTKDRFRQLWHFLVSVCRALQQGENRLSAYEAYWLGLIDEVPGSSLSSMREVIENINTVPVPVALGPKPKKRRKAKMPSKSAKKLVADK